ncbi:MAG TPA: V-type ATP synthase subunit D [Gemmatimonadaceae bacterium]|nr:V-type ATP synthase subunit D [Gemmatimonadaceae bacterium]
MSARDHLAPTRMNLLRARRELTRVAKGAHLIRRKREALVVELFRLARPAIDVRARIGVAMDAAGLALADALAAHGGTGLGAMSLPTRDLVVKLRPAVVWGIAVTDVEGHTPVGRTVDARGLAPAITGPAASETAERFEALAEMLIEAAPREQRVRRLGQALAETTRRLRTLEQRIAPRLESQISAVRDALEEREREEQLRLRHVQRERPV